MGDEDSSTTKIMRTPYSATVTQVLATQPSIARASEDFWLLMCRHRCKRRHIRVIFQGVHWQVERVHTNNLQRLRKDPLNSRIHAIYSDLCELPHLFGQRSWLQPEPQIVGLTSQKAFRRSGVPSKAPKNGIWKLFSSTYSVWKPRLLRRGGAPLLFCFSILYSSLDNLSVI